MGYKLGKKSLRNLVGVHPILGFAVNEAIKISKVDFGVMEGVRSMDRQRKLVMTGASKTYNSYHLYGLAVDLVPYMNGRYTWEDNGNFELINEAMSDVIAMHDLPIDWGFALWGWDKPHYQMTGWRKKYDIRKIAPKLPTCLK